MEPHNTVSCNDHYKPAFEQLPPYVQVIANQATVLGEMNVRSQQIWDWRERAERAEAKVAELDHSRNMWREESNRQDKVIAQLSETINKLQKRDAPKAAKKTAKGTK